MPHSFTFSRVIALAILLGARAATGAPQDIQLPADLTVEAPDTTIDVQLASFSGKWYGEWRGERTNALMAEQMIVVERVSAASISVVYVGIGRFGQLVGKRWNYRVAADFVDGVLRFSIPNGGPVVTCKPSQDGTLAVRGDTPSGSWIATMRKLQD